MSKTQGENATSPQASVSAWLDNPMYMGFIGVLLAFLVYLPTLGFDFVWDDHMQIVANPLILSWRMIPRALQSNLWFQIAPTGTYYRPFFIIWSIFNHALFGFDPRGWHLLNVVLHVNCHVVRFCAPSQVKGRLLDGGFGRDLLCSSPGSH